MLISPICNFSCEFSYNAKRPGGHTSPFSHFSICLIMHLCQRHFYLPRPKKAFYLLILTMWFFFLLSKINLRTWKTEMFVITASNRWDVNRKRIHLDFISSPRNSPEAKQLRCVNSSVQSQVLSQISEALKELWRINCRPVMRKVLCKGTVILSWFWLFSMNHFRLHFSLTL